MGSMVDLFGPIATAWDAGGLDDLIAGPFKDVAPDNQARPYCVVSLVAARKAFFTDQKTHWEIFVDFIVRDTTFELCGAHLNSIGAVFEAAGFTLTPSDGYVMQIDRVAETYFEEDDSMHAGVLSYMFHWARTRA